MRNAGLPVPGGARPCTAVSRTSHSRAPCWVSAHAVHGSLDVDDLKTRTGIAGKVAKAMETVIRGVKMKSRSVMAATTSSDRYWRCNFTRHIRAGFTDRTQNPLSKDSEENGGDDLPIRIGRVWYINRYGYEIRSIPNPNVAAGICSAGALVYNAESLYTSLMLRGIGAAFAGSITGLKLLSLSALDSVAMHGGRLRAVDRARAGAESQGDYTAYAGDEQQRSRQNFRRGNESVKSVAANGALSTSGAGAAAAGAEGVPHVNRGVLARLGVDCVRLGIKDKFIQSSKVANSVTLRISNQIACETIGNICLYVKTGNEKATGVLVISQQPTTPAPSRRVEPAGISDIESKFRKRFCAYHG
ncbi:hypothetical protein DL771_011642 [Monosporascus sp. 5C6A]|nr:hypothetical protein DL771_011642 [Monosporascus sp. 5C6A]